MNELKRNELIGRPQKDLDEPVSRQTEWRRRKRQQQSEPLLGITDACLLVTTSGYNVHGREVRRWIAKGLLKAQKVPNPRGFGYRYEINLKEFERVVARQSAQEGHKREGRNTLEYAIEHSRQVMVYRDNHSMEKTLEYFNITSWVLYSLYYKLGREDLVAPSILGFLKKKYGRGSEMEELPKRDSVCCDDVVVVDEFFENFGALISEIKDLRRERDEYKQKATKWAAQITELQQLMAHRE